MKIDGRPFILYFEFTEGDTLKEITFRSAPFPEAEYSTRMRETLKQLVKHFEGAFGKAGAKASLPSPTQMQEGMSAIGTHIWDQPDRSYFLGVGKADGGISFFISSQRLSYRSQLIKYKGIPGPTTNHAPEGIVPLKIK